MMVRSFLKDFWRYLLDLPNEASRRMDAWAEQANPRAKHGRCMACGLCKPSHYMATGSLCFPTARIVT
jgi:hypothetical protein